MAIFWVLTGGPMAGKSTVLKAISRRFGNRVVTVPEAATDLFESGYPQPGRDCEWSPEWQSAFQGAVLRRQYELEEAALDEARSRGAALIICDRGVLDGAAYTPGGQTAFAKQYGVDLTAARFRYARVLHLESLATCRPQLFGTAGNACRYEGLAQAKDLEHSTRAAWHGHADWRFFSGLSGLESTTRIILGLIEEEIGRENERKWRIASPACLPPSARRQEICQGYLLTEEGELRLRLAGRRAYLTIKGEGDESRPEWERPLPRWAFDQLWPKTNGARVRKLRQRIACPGTRHGYLEADIYQGELTGLCLLEAEFASRAQAASFVLPDRFGPAREVTADRRYKNKSLACQGLPE